MNGSSVIGMCPGLIGSLLVHVNLPHQFLVIQQFKIFILTGCNVYRKTVLSVKRYKQSNLGLFVYLEQLITCLECSKEIQKLVKEGKESSSRCFCAEKQREASNIQSNVYA